jgi:predicted nucleic acid-binding protein
VIWEGGGNMIVVLDNTVLSNFAQTQIDSAINSLWGDQVCTTLDVISEYRAGIKSVGLPASAWEFLKINELSLVEIDFATSLSSKLGKGECSCIAIAYLRNAILATDDLFARKVADRYHIQKIGTVGILLQCVRREILTVTVAQKALNEMINFGYRSPVTDLTSFFHP